MTLDCFRRTEPVEVRVEPPFDRLRVTVNFFRRTELVEVRDASPFDTLRVTVDSVLVLTRDSCGQYLSNRSARIFWSTQCGYASI